MVKEEKAKVNFLPEDYLEKRAQRRSNLVCLILFLLVMGALAGAFVMTEQRKKKAEGEYQKVNAELLAMSKSLVQVDALEAKKREMKEKAQISAQLIEPVPRSLLLAIITNHMPAGVSLIDYDLQTKEVQDKTAPASPAKGVRKTAAAAAAKLTKTQTVMNIKGLAQDDLQVARLCSNLNRSPLLGNVTLISTKEFEVEKQPLRQFEVAVILPSDAKATLEDIQLARQWRQTKKATQTGLGNLLGSLKAVKGN